MRDRWPHPPRGAIAGIWFWPPMSPGDQVVATQLSPRTSGEQPAARASGVRLDLGKEASAWAIA